MLIEAGRMTCFWSLDALFSILSGTKTRESWGLLLVMEIDELRRDSGEWRRRGAQRPDYYGFVQGYSWGEQPGGAKCFFERAEPPSS